MWGRVPWCGFLAAGCCAGVCGSALGGVIVWPIAEADRAAPIAARLDAEYFSPPRDPHQTAPGVLAARVPSSPLSITPWRQTPPAQGSLQPADVAATATFITSFPLGAPRPVVASPAQAVRPLAGVIPPPELPDNDPFVEDLFSARDQNRSGIVEFFSVPSPAGVTAFTPLVLLAARRRRAR